MATFTVDSQHFGPAARYVARAVGKDETRQGLTGITMEADGESLTIVATDGYRLHHVVIPAEVGTAGIVRMTRADALTVGKMTGTIGITSDATTVLVCEDWANWCKGDPEHRFKAIEGNYVRWRMIVPPAAKLPITWDMDPRALAGVLRAARSCRAEQIILEANGTPGFLEVSWKDKAGNVCDDLVPADCIGHLCIAFEPRFLLDAIPLKSARVRLNLSHQHKAATMADAVIMPRHTVSVRYGSTY